VESLSSFIGVDGTNTTLNSGRLLINLKPLSERNARASEVIRRLQPKLDTVEGIKLYMQPVQDLTIEERISRTQYQFTLEATDPKELGVLVPKLVDRLAALPQLVDVASDLQDQGLQVFLTIDRDSAGRLGVTPAAIDNALYNAFGQRLVSTIFTQSNQYRVVLEVKPEFRSGPDALKDIYVASSSGTQVPLTAITQSAVGTAPLVVNHLGQFPAATISFNLAPGAALGDAVQAIERVAGEIGLPASIQTGFQGAALAFRASLTNMLLLILAAVVTVYIVLGVLYESFVHPITILSTLPSAAVGA
jgi:multidrug efflux pump